jgi:DNA 3'-phosphatase
MFSTQVTAGTGTLMYYLPPIIGGYEVAKSPPHHLTVTASQSNTIIFDLDHTLIQPKSHRKMPRDNDDWEFLIPPSILQAYASQNWRIVIMTNQKRLTPADINYKLGNIITQLETLGINVYVLVATHEDFYRKPSIGMWTFLTTQLQQQDATTTVVWGHGGAQSPLVIGGYGGAKSPPAAYVMIGDSAGRPGDFSAADLMFAINANIPFLTPEQFISHLSHPPSSAAHLHEITFPLTQRLTDELYTVHNTTAAGAVKYFIPHLYTLPSPPAVPMHHGHLNSITFTTPAAVLLMGPPASTKSTIAAYLMTSSHPLLKWHILERDTFTTAAKYKSAVLTHISENHNIIIDATHRTTENRQKSLSSIPKHYNKYVILLDLPKLLVIHLNDLRNKFINANTATEGHGGAQSAPADDTTVVKSKKTVPTVAIHSWYKYRELPSTSEGYTAIYTINTILTEAMGALGERSHPQFHYLNC